MMNPLAPPESPMESMISGSNYNDSPDEDKGPTEAGDSLQHDGNGEKDGGIFTNESNSNFDLEKENDDILENRASMTPETEKGSVDAHRKDSTKFSSSENNALVSIFEVAESGPLGIKTEVVDKEMIIAFATPGLHAHKMGIRRGDYIVAAELTGLKGATCPNWKETMSAHELYPILMSRHRPLHLKIRRRGRPTESDENTKPGTKRRQWTKDDSNNTGALVQKKRGRPSVNKVKVDVEYRVQKEVEQLRQWREGIIHAIELKKAADEIEFHNFGSAEGSAMGDFAQQSIKNHIESLRTEAENLWSNPNHSWWENNLKAYLVFKEEFGHGRISKEMKSRGDLHDWAHRMRDKYRSSGKGEAKTIRNKLLRSVEYDILKKVGFDFEAFNGNWDYMFNKMLEYKEKHGTFVPPRKSAKEDKEIQRLADWVVHQRSKYREKHDPDRPNRTGVLTDGQERRLTEVGFVFMEKIQWEDHYEALKQWIAENGHARIPKVYPQNQPLSSFVHTNRRYRMWQLEGKERAVKAWRRLTPERIKMLDDIGFIWDTNGTSLITRKTPRLRKGREENSEQGSVYEENNSTRQQPSLRDVLDADIRPMTEEQDAPMHLEQMHPTGAQYQVAHTMNGEVSTMHTEATVGIPPMNEQYFLYGRGANI